MLRAVTRKAGLALLTAAPPLALVAWVAGARVVCEAQEANVPCVPTASLHGFWGWTLLCAAAALAITGAAALAFGRGTLGPSARDTRRGYLALLAFCLAVGLLLPTAATARTTSCTMVFTADGPPVAQACPGPPASFFAFLGATVVLAMLGAWGLTYRGALAVARRVLHEPAEPDTV